MNCIICGDYLLKRHKKYCSQKCHGEADRIENKCQEEYLLKSLIRFNKYISKTESCWLWKGGINECGYGKFSLFRKTIGAHRAAYMFFKKDIKENLLVLHKCDNPPCVNPEHLFLGTPKDNSRDMFNKKRNNTARGESHKNSKLNNKKVIGIKRLLKLGIEGSEIAKLLNVSPSTIYDIKNKGAWGHIKLNSKT